jgi:hypothetical protein
MHSGWTFREEYRNNGYEIHKIHPKFFDEIKIVDENGLEVSAKEVLLVNENEESYMKSWRGFFMCIKKKEEKFIVVWHINILSQCRLTQTQHYLLPDYRRLMATLNIFEALRREQGTISLRPSLGCNAIEEGMEKRKDPNVLREMPGKRNTPTKKGLSTLTPRVNDSSALDRVSDLDRVLRESARQSPERQLLRRRLDGLGLRENEVGADGNCQFRAIADQLYDSPDRYKEVRADIVEHLRSNESLYSGFVHDIQYDAYIEDMGRDRTWGDHVTLQAASNVYGLEIQLYTSYDEDWERVIVPTDGGNIRRVIQLSFYAELHYNSVSRVNRNKMPLQGSKK